MSRLCAAHKNLVALFTRAGKAKIRNPSRTLAKAPLCVFFKITPRWGNYIWQRKLLRWPTVNYHHKGWRPACGGPSLSV